MREQLEIKIEKPQYITVTGLTFTQTESWFGHEEKDLRMDLIYPEDSSKAYPCIVWICGGAWLSMDKSAHLTYLSRLAMEGFVVASVEYRTSNETKFPGQLEDVKAAIRYLKARASRFHINPNKIGVMGESAGAHLALMAAFQKDIRFDVGQYLDYTSEVQAVTAWYPPTDFRSMQSASSGPASAESLLLGKSVKENLEEADLVCPLNYVTKESVPTLLLHGNQDHTVPFQQSELLYNKLEEKGCDVTLLELEGADHADLGFFQEEIWDRIADFFAEKLK